MKVSVTTKLPCSAMQAWDAVIQSSTLCRVAWPLARIKSSRTTLPKQWTEGQTWYCRSYLFGIIPVGERKIFFERINPIEKKLGTRESDVLIRQWDHLISVKPFDESSCDYTDDIIIEAGSLTFLVWIWANWFYRHRQARLRKLILGKV